MRARTTMRFPAGVQWLRLRGWRAFAALLAFGLIVVAAVTIVVFLGIALAVAGVIASAVAALVYAWHRHFQRPGRLQDPPPHRDLPVLPPSGEVRDIKVDQIVVERDR